MNQTNYVWMRDDEYISVDYHSGGYVWFTSSFSQARFLHDKGAALEFRDKWLSSEYARAQTWQLHAVNVWPAQEA